MLTPPRQTSLYHFPESNLFRAMEATEPEFDIFEKGRGQLYVPLQSLRTRKQFSHIRRLLGIEGQQLQNTPNDYVKILFSGHRGCGKTVELIRFHEEINRPELYFSVFVSLQEEVELRRFQPEDLYFVLIGKLLRSLKAHNIDYNKADFEEIANSWVEDEEIQKEIRSKRGIESGAGAKAGFSFWDIFSSEGFLKGFYGYENATTTKIRQSIRRNPEDLVQRFNRALIKVRSAIEKKGKGNDLLFVVDDFEKTAPEVYENIFIRDPHFVREMRAHLICCVPIQTYYDVQNQHAADLFKLSYLPMIRTEQGADEFVKIVTRRVDAKLFEPGVLERMVRYSGGSPRQLLRIANQCLLDAETTVSDGVLSDALKRLSIERIRPLSEAHRKILRARRFDDISKDLLDLLFSLNVMEYNGDTIERRINPLLEDEFPVPKIRASST